jgi:Fe/S biogenesis protein NfuA
MADEGTLLQVSDGAKALVLEARNSEPDADALALWLEVTGVGLEGFTYDLYFQAMGDASPGDRVEDHDGLHVVVPEASIERLRSAVVDVAGDGDGAGMVVRNPNTPPHPKPGGGLPPGFTPDLSGEVAQRVVQILDHDVNPAIAAHGGHAELVTVDEGTAYLRLSGGCQGCAMSRATLTQGIEVAIKEAVPEVLAVMDVTDHASGTDPYF